MQRYFFDVVGHGRSELDLLDANCPHPRQPMTLPSLWHWILQWTIRSGGLLMCPM